MQRQEVNWIMNLQSLEFRVMITTHLHLFNANADISNRIEYEIIRMEQQNQCWFLHGGNYNIMQ